MSDLLTRMITRAQRPPASVMPVMPSRFEQSQFVAGLEERVETRPVEHPAPDRRTTAALQESPKSEFQRGKSEWPLAQRLENTTPPPPAPQSAEVRAPRADASPVMPQASAVENNTSLEPDKHEPAKIPTVVLTPGQTQLARKEPEPKRPNKGDPQRLEPRPGEAKPEQSVEVHVTIGRIEVRQAAPPAPEKARALAPPLVRLEDYLKKREAR